MHVLPRACVRACHERGQARVRRAASTLAVVALRRVLPEFTVPGFKTTAAEIYDAVGAALAAADGARLRLLTTPSCFTKMAASLRARGVGERHEWRALGTRASIKQVRIGHNASAGTVQYVQVTAHIDARLVWQVRDAEGALVGGAGAEGAPFNASDYWVFERCLAGVHPAWRLKERLEVAPPGVAKERVR